MIVNVIFTCLPLNHVYLLQAQRVIAVSAQPDYSARRSSHSVDASSRSSSAARNRRAVSPKPVSYTPPTSYGSAPAKANPVDYGASRRSNHSVNPTQRSSAAMRASRSPAARAAYTPPTPSS